MTTKDGLMKIQQILKEMIKLPWLWLWWAFIAVFFARMVYLDASGWWFFLLISALLFAVSFLPFIPDESLAANDVAGADASVTACGDGGCAF